MPIQDLDAKRDIYVSQFIVVTNGKITDNAKEKMINLVKDPSIKHNLDFID